MLGSGTKIENTIGITQEIPQVYIPLLREIPRAIDPQPNIKQTPPRGVKTPIKLGMVSLTSLKTRIYNEPENKSTPAINQRKIHARALWETKPEDQTINKAKRCIT